MLVWITQNGGQFQPYPLDTIIGVVGKAKLPQSILHHPVLAGPPAGAGMVALKDERGFLPAELA